MFTLFFLLPVLVVGVLVSAVVRLLVSPFRHHRHRGWGGSGWGRYGGYGNGWNGYGYNGCGYGRRGFGGGGLMTVLGLLALERLFGRRW